MNANSKPTPPAQTDVVSNLAVAVSDLAVTDCGNDAMRDIKEREIVQFFLEHAKGLGSTEPDASPITEAWIFKCVVADWIKFRIVIGFFEIYFSFDLDTFSADLKVVLNVLGIGHLYLAKKQGNLKEGLEITIITISEMPNGSITIKFDDACVSMQWDLRAFGKMWKDCGYIIETPIVPKEG